MNKLNPLVKSVIISTGIFLSSLVLASQVFASGECTPLYGGGYTCPRRGEILIDKQVKNPSSGIFVDNLTEFDPKFAPEQEVTFRIQVKNTGDETIDDIQVKDIMPDFLSFIAGPGNFNSTEGKNGTLTFNIKNLAPSETREYWIQGKVFADSGVPKNLICKLENRAQARASGDRFTEDIAQYCTEKGTVTKGGVTEVPKTGPEAILSFLGLSSLLGSGVYLRRKAAQILG